MKKSKGFTLIELMAAMAMMVVLLNTFAFMLSGSAAIIKQDKQKVKAVSYSQYIMQTMKSYGKNYYTVNIGIVPTSGVTSGYFYFKDKNELSQIIDSTSFRNDIIDGSAGKVFLGSYTQMLSKSAGKLYGAYFELSSSADMGKDESNSSDIKLNGFEYIRIYVKVVDLKSTDKYNSDLTFFIGR